MRVQVKHCQHLKQMNGGAEEQERRGDKVTNNNIKKTVETFHIWTKGSSYGTWQVERRHKERKKKMTKMPDEVQTC